MSVISGWQQRLIALADNPEYVYRDTPRELIEQDYRRLTTFAGYSEQEVAQAEGRLGVCFPGVFRQYLLAMGKSRGHRIYRQRVGMRPGIRDRRRGRPGVARPPEAILVIRNGVAGTRKRFRKLPHGVRVRSVGSLAMPERVETYRCGAGVMPCGGGVCRVAWL